MTRFFGFLLIPLLVLGACGDDTTPVKNDGKVTQKDGGADSAPPPTGLDCTTATNCKSYVFNKLILPADSAQTQKFAIDFDKDGTPDNQLGAILSALAGATQGLALQDSVDAAMNQGTTIILLKVQGGDFSNAPKAAAQAWIGQKAECCPTDKTDPVKCAAEAATTCFKGSFEFTKDPVSPSDALFGGAITGGEGTFGPAKLTITLPLTDAGAITVALQKAQFKVTFAGDKITGGVLAGGITEDDLNKQVIPGVAKLMDNTVQDPGTSTSTKDQILQFFDADKDGKITEAEVKANALISAFLAGDVDVDGDGTLELSLGVGFEAVGAVIK